MSDMFPYLSAPITMGGIEIRNRILSTGHMTCMISGGVPLPMFADYHEARARGGCGLIITESAAVSAFTVNMFSDGGQSIRM